MDKSQNVYGKWKKQGQKSAYYLFHLWEASRIDETADRKWINTGWGLGGEGTESDS